MIFLLNKTTQVQGLESKLDVKRWMINNQFSRRNLFIEVRLALAYQFKEFETDKANARQGTRHDLVKENSNISLPVGLSCVEFIKTNDPKGKTLEVIAKKAGVSPMTAFQYDKIQTKGTEQKAEVVSKNSSIKKVYTQIQRAELYKSTYKIWSG